VDIAVFGSGYVGLVAGTCFADCGNKVTCVDIDEEKINKLRKGYIPIYEPGLDQLIIKNVKEKRLYFTTAFKKSIEENEIIFIAVGTPSDKDGSADLKYVLSVAESIGKYINNYKAIVIKSTVPVGTANNINEKIKSLTDIDFDVINNPEFLKEGAAIDDFLRPDRIIVGVSTEKSQTIMEELYAPFIRNNHPIYFMDYLSAEMTKYAANAMLATRISFMNEISNLCDAVGADVNMVRKGIGSDKRIGSAFLYPGIGYGGSCFPKDVKAIINTACRAGTKLRVLNAVEEVNEKQKVIIIDRIIKYFNNELTGKTFALWGLAFKPKTDDIREAPAVSIINSLLKIGCKLEVSDPEAIPPIKKIFSDKISYHNDPYECLKEASGLIIATEWNEYRNPDFKRIKTALKVPVIFDGRNIYNKRLIESKGLDYYCIGAN